MIPLELVTDHTKRSFQNCPREYKLYHLDRIKKKGEKSPFRIGSFVHEGFEYLFKNSIIRWKEPYKSQFIGFLNTLEDKWQAQNLKMNITEKEIVKWTRDFAVVKGILINAVRFRLVDKMLQEYEIVYIEERINTRAIHPEVLYSIRPDIVLKARKTGEVTVFDFKTASNPGSSLFKDLRERYQIVGYAEALEKELGLLISNGSYIVFEKCQIRGGARDTASTLSNRIVDWYKDEKKFHKITFELNPKLRARFKKDFKETMDMMKFCHEKGVFPRYESSCIPLGMDWAACQFLDLCKNPTTEILEREYEARPTEDYEVDIKGTGPVKR